MKAIVRTLIGLPIPHARKVLVVGSIIVLGMLLADSTGDRIRADNTAFHGEIAYFSCRVDTDDEPPSDIYVFNLDDNTTRQLTVDPAMDVSPEWSPDGTELLFVSNRTGEMRIYVMDANGENVRSLGAGTMPAWSPDGTQIAYGVVISEPHAQAPRYAIYIMDADGENVRPLETDTMPVWSPDGTQIAYGVIISEPHSQGNRYALYMMNRDTTHQRRISPDQFVNAYAPAWSPDGQQIIFSARRGSENYGELYTLDLATGSLTQLTATPDLTEAYAEFSPDGEFIIFSGDDGVNIEIYKMRSDGSEVAVLTTLDDAVRNYTPTWSPDGRAIAFFTQYGFGDEPPEPNGIYVMNADGSERRLVVENGCSPDWRPDGPASS